MFRAFKRNLCVSLALAAAMAAVLTLRGTFNLDNLLTAIGVSCALGFSGMFQPRTGHAPQGESRHGSPIGHNDTPR